MINCLAFCLIRQMSLTLAEIKIQLHELKSVMQFLDMSVVLGFLSKPELLPSLIIRMVVLSVSYVLGVRARRLGSQSCWDLCTWMGRGGVRNQIK